MVTDMRLTAVARPMPAAAVFAFFPPRGAHVAANNAPAADVTDCHADRATRDHHNGAVRMRRRRRLDAAVAKNRCSDRHVVVRRDIIRAGRRRTTLLPRHDIAACHKGDQPSGVNLMRYMWTESADFIHKQ